MDFVKAGKTAEENFVIVNNFNKSKSNPIWNFFIVNNLIHENEIINYYFVRVTSQVYSTLVNKKVYPKSDVYIIKANISETLLKEKKYLLTEEELKLFSYSIMKNSGISIKRESSKNYQIIKMNPSCFYSLFNNFELGAAASLFCKNINEFYKNHLVLKGWHTNIEKLETYFNQKISFAATEENKNNLKLLKNQAINTIETLINSSPQISEKIFFGKGVFADPYYATFSYFHGIFSYIEKIPFTVTTGSGRSHGDFTIVLKPK